MTNEEILHRAWIKAEDEADRLAGELENAEDWWRAAKAALHKKNAEIAELRAWKRGVLAPYIEPYRIK